MVSIFHIVGGAYQYYYLDPKLNRPGFASSSPLARPSGDGSLPASSASPLCCSESS